MTLDFKDSSGIDIVPKSYKAQQERLFDILQLTHYNSNYIHEIRYYAHSYIKIKTRFIYSL